MVVLLLAFLFLWYAFYPDPKVNPQQGKVGVDQHQTHWFVSLLIMVFPALVLFGLFFFLLRAPLRGNSKPINVHWKLTGAVLAFLLFFPTLAVFGLMDFVSAVSGGVILAALLSFFFHVFSPFWYHLRTGAYLSALERLPEAERHLQKAWSLAQKYKENDFRRGIVLLIMADWLRAKFLLDDAERLYQQALPILQQHAKNHFVELLQVLNNLGVLYSDQGKYIEAEVYFRQAHSLVADRKGWLAALTQHNIAWIYLDQGKYEEAEGPLLAAEKLSRKNLPMHLLVLGKLAKLHLGKNNHELGDTFAREGLAALEKARWLPPKVILVFLASVVEVYRRLGKLDEAESHARRALKIAEEIGNYPPARFKALTSLAAVCLAQNELVEAETLFRGALALHEEARLPDKPDWADSLEEFASLLRRTGRDQEATDWETRAHTIRTHWLEYQASPRVKEERLVNLQPGFRQANH